MKKGLAFMPSILMMLFVAACSNTQQNDITDLVSGEELPQAAETTLNVR